MLLKFNVLMLVVIALAPFWAHAQGEGVSVGGAVLTPAVDLEMGYRDNITRARLDDDKISALVTVLTPSIGFAAESGANQYSLDYELGHGIYKGSDEDNYTDHTLNAASILSLSSRNRLSFSGGYRLGHDERGAAFSQGFGDELVELDTHATTDIDAVYNYGTESAGAGLELRVGLNDLNYDARLVAGELVDRTLVRNRKTKDAGATYSWGVGNRATLLVEANVAKTEYETLSPQGSLDSDEAAILLGGTWQGTAKTTGAIRVGYVERDFVNEARQDFSGPQWDVSVEYMFRSYSIFTFTTEQRGRENNGVGDFINTTAHRLTWSHEWGPRVSSALSYSLGKDDYEGLLREDGTQSYSANINYALGRTMSLRLGFTRVLLNSNENIFDTDSNTAFLGVTVAL